MWPSSRSTGSASPSSTGAGSTPAPLRAATASAATTSPPTSRPSGPCPCPSPRSGDVEVRGEIFLPTETFLAINREREEKEEPLFANPAERRRRLHPPPRRQAGRIAEPGRLPLHPVRRRAGAGLPVGEPAAPARTRLQDESALAALCGDRGRPRLLPRMDGEEGHPRLRSRRRRRQDRLRASAPPDPRDDGQIAALGDLLQVPGPPGHDPDRRHRHPGRPDGRPDAGRRPRARQAFRHDDQPLDAPQRGRAPAQGHPHRRRHPPRAERRRHPPRRIGDEGAPDREGAALRLAGEVPRLPYGRLPARGRSRLPLCQPVMPGPDPGVHPPLRLAPGHEHRRPGRGARRPAPGERARPGDPGPLRPRSSTTWPTWSAWGPRAREPPGPDRSVQDEGPRPPRLRPGHPSRRGAARPDPGRAVPDASTRSAAAPAEELADGRGRRSPKVAESVVFFFAQDENRKLLARLKKAGLDPLVRRGRPRPEARSRDRSSSSRGRSRSFSRDEARRRIEVLGGETADAVSGKTTCLVAGESPGLQARQGQEPWGSGSSGKRNS